VDATARFYILIVTLGLLPAVASAGTYPGLRPIPPELQGEWAQDGKCSDASKRLTLTRDIGKSGATYVAAMGYTDFASKTSGLRWADEDDVEVFEYIPRRDVLMEHNMGWGTPPSALYKRCLHSAN
jgi:hypothetical protein